MTETEIRSSEAAGPKMAELCLPSHLRKPRLRRWEASEYLELAHGIRLSTATLAKYATTGGGPAYHKSLRTPLYPREELDRWAADRLGDLKTSTSDAGAQQ